MTKEDRVTEKPVSEGLFKYEEVVVTVELPTAVCRQLTEAAVALRKVTGTQASIFWIPTTVTHLSLLFTGRVREDLVSVLVGAWQPVVAAIPAFTLRAKGLQLYREGEGESEVTKAIWAGVETSDELLALRQKLVETLETLEVQVAVEVFDPHVPLALADEFRNTREFSTVFSQWQMKDFGEIPVAALTVKVANPVQGDLDAPFTLKGTLPLGS